MADEHGPATRIAIEARPERRLLRRGGDERHVDLHLRVTRPAADAARARPALHLGLVLDRSGSMRGQKLEMAKRAALAVLDRLDGRDRVALVVFDDRIDTLQPAVPASADIKAHARAALARIEARGSTALHEGWLTGCQAIAADGVEAARDAGALARCFLLTDGLANVGIQEPDALATQASGVLRNAGVGTSTFGIGEDYDESLLGPMAAAGGGEFYHLRVAEEIVGTFVGELGELLAVAARQVRLEIETGPGVEVEVVSAYRPSAPDGTRHSIPIGDLLSGEERHVVVRFGFPAAGDRPDEVLRARAVWTDDGAERAGGWESVHLVYADDAACEAEPPDAAVTHWVGIEQADDAQRRALSLGRRGDWQGARRLLFARAQALDPSAAGDPTLQARVAELRQLSEEAARGPLPSARSKEAYFQSQTRSHGKAWRDHRGPSDPSGPAAPSDPPGPPSRPSGPPRP